MPMRTCAISRAWSPLPAGRWGAEEVAAALGEKDIAVRAGLHCAPLAHETAGTVDTGTVRISFSDYNTPREVEDFLGILGEILTQECIDISEQTVNFGMVYLEIYRQILYNLSIHGQKGLMVLPWNWIS